MSGITYSFYFPEDISHRVFSEGKEKLSNFFKAFFPYSSVKIISDFSRKRIIIECSSLYSLPPEFPRSSDTKKLGLQIKRKSGKKSTYHVL